MTNLVYDDPARPHAVKSVQLSGQYGYAYSYDADGNMASRQYTGYPAHQFSYDSANRLTCMGNASLACEYLSAGYDVDGDRMVTGRSCM